jgi:hypothetical protein
VGAVVEKFICHARDGVGLNVPSKSMSMAAAKPRAPEENLI